MENQENESFNVSDLAIEKLIPNTFDNCIVTIFEGHHTLDLPSSVTGMVLKNWLKTKGGIFSKDVYRFANNKSHGKYVLYDGLANKFVARLIEEDELLVFESLNLVDGYLKDKPYMILKTLTDDDELTSIKRYIETLPETHDDVVNSHHVEDAEEEEIPFNSVSLFNDNE